MVQRQKSWYMLLFQLVGLAEQWLNRDDYANFREMLAEHPDREQVIERMRGDWRYARVDGAGHWLQLDEPKKVNALLLDFFAES